MIDTETHRLLPEVLTPEQIRTLKDVCREALAPEADLSSYIFLNRQDNPVYQKIKSLVEEFMCSEIFYLNDFYFYTDEGFGADWHVDTEMFAFERAVNAWILLSPEVIEGPIAFISETNHSKDAYFHSLRMSGDICNFVNFTNFGMRECSLKVVEDNSIEAPEVNLGDILLLNPKRFHRTASVKPKHALVIKFVVPERNSFRTKMPVPDVVWPEVAVFDDLIREPSDWSASLDAIRQKLADPVTRPIMTEGFFPEKLSLFKAMVRTL